MEKLKTSIQTTTVKVNRIIIGILAVIFLLIGITATFFHRGWSEENPKIKKLNKERTVLKNYWNKRETKHDSLFINDLISKETYFKIKIENEVKRKSDFKKISSKRKVIAHNFSFKGRTSFSYWLWIFGIFLTQFIISCFLILKDNRLRAVGLLKWYEPYASISFIMVSLFWLYHTLFRTSKDFEFTFYTYVLVIILIPTSYFVYHFLRRFLFIEEKLLQNIRDLVSHVIYNTKEEKEEDKWDLLDKISKNGE